MVFSGDRGEQGLQFQDGGGAGGENFDNYPLKVSLLIVYCSPSFITSQPIENIII